MNQPYVMQFQKQSNKQSTIEREKNGSQEKKEGFGVKIMDLAKREVEAVRYAFQKLGAH